MSCNRFPMQPVWLLLLSTLFALGTLIYQHDRLDFLSPDAHYGSNMEVWLGRQGDTRARASVERTGYRLRSRPQHTGLNTSASRALPSTIYLEYAWEDMHSEIFYSLIREFCLDSEDKDSMWHIGARVTFHLGPVNRMSPSLMNIWQKFNGTDPVACGPIRFGKPTGTDPDLTVLTTTYAKPTYTPDFIDQHVNNSKFLLICHDDHPEMEFAWNVFWLSPHHRRYLVPNYFPKFFSALRTKSSTPVFLVLGKATPRKRNVDSLREILNRYREEDYVIRIMGKQFPGFLGRFDKVEYVELPDASSFVGNMSDVFAILPLVDETNFFATYGGGSKLSSSVMWAQGLGLPLVLYRELAYVYNVHEGFIYDEDPTREQMRPSVAHWMSENGRATTFGDAFGESLRYFNNAYER